MLKKLKLFSITDNHANHLNNIAKIILKRVAAFFVSVGLVRVRAIACV